MQKKSPHRPQKSFKAEHKRLLEWYEKEGRHELLWRRTDKLYHIYLSEIMLQQTQVSRVESLFYPAFLEKFPTLEALANATQDDVLAAWSGLGYYSRARNLQKSAQIVKGSLPKTQEELIKLPGIGRYTASAICCFGLNQKIPVVDTNIARVLKRYFGLFEKKESEVWKSALELLNNNEPRKHNLALMDLGSLICLPKNPKCDECPLQKSCIGKNEPQLYTQTKKISYESLELFYGICIKDGKIALRTSQESMYKEMLTLPSTEPIEENFIGSFKHSYTKYRLTVKLYRVEEVSNEPKWIELNSVKSSPISSLTKKAEKFFRH